MKVKKEMAEFYFPTHTKMVSYVMGMVGGYVLHLTKRKRMNFKLNLVSRWLSSVFVKILNETKMYAISQLINRK